MPYAFAHPLAVIPLHRVLGRMSVPSALAIGSVIPDAWYLVPGLVRHDSHGLVYGILLFCLPAGLLAYLAFHLIFKLPLVALLPQGLGARLQALTVRGLPRKPWFAVLTSLAAGAATHLAWDSLTHEGPLSEAFPVLERAAFAWGTYKVPLHQFLQHASTLLGTGILAWWTLKKLRSVPATGRTREMSPAARAAWLLVLFAVPAGVFASVFLYSIPLQALELEDARRFARAGGVAAFSALGIVATAYCLAWRGAGRKRRLG